VRYMGRRTRIPKSEQSPAASLLPLLPKKKRRPPTDWPGALAKHCAFARLPNPVREFRFHHTRQWRFDLAWVEHRFAVEVDGGLHVHGGHNRGAYIEETMVKYAEAILAGWRVLRVSPKHVESGQALVWVEGCLKGPPAPPPGRQAALALGHGG